MAKKLEREGFIDLTIVKNFLAGFKHTKHSKVFLRIEQIDGYNYICVYLDNNYTSDEVTSATHLNEVNGFRKWFHIKINKVEQPETLMETVQDVTTIAWDMVKDNPLFEKEGIDSRMFFSLCRGWAKEFEEYFNSEQIDCKHPERNYYDEVEIFTEKKVNEWLSYHK